MTVCIQYAKPSSGQLEGEVYGLDVAVNNFLSAWFRHGTTNKFICRPIDLESFGHFQALAQAEGIDAEARCIGLDPRSPQYNLSSISCMFRPDPLISTPMWQRLQVKGDGFASCGLIHTMSGERIARAVGELCLSPSSAGDALICPSPAIRDAVQNLWSIYTEYLNHHFGSTYRCSIETPVIPLGVDCNKFKRLTTADKRIHQRRVLEVNHDDVVILFLGRLSFATKAHPLALWKAAEQAASRTRRKLRVVMYGYFKPKEMEQHFRSLAASVFKNVRIDFIMNEDPRFPDGLWAGSDIFVSLSDNIQESFGLTPLEAMAAGLPAIVSDWDGYRGGVREGQDGFLIPTLTPPPESGMAIAKHYLNEQNYGVALVGAAQSTFVDTARCAEALSLLIDDDIMRRVMGQSGRLRAESVFDWRHIIKAYEELWSDLAQKRKAASATPTVPQNWQAAHPAFPNPWKMFASFPSGFLKPEDRLRTVMGRAEIEALMAHEMNFFVPDLLMPKELILNLIEIFQKSGPTSIDQIIGGFPPQERDRAWRCIGWMLKLGICALERKSV